MDLDVYTQYASMIGSFCPNTPDFVYVLQKCHIQNPTSLHYNALVGSLWRLEPHKICTEFPFNQETATVK